jgi:hypothetical protein
VPVQELDWIICNGGADVWHLLPERDGKEATWVADEQWEGHISFRCPSLALLFSTPRESSAREPESNNDGQCSARLAGTHSIFLLSLHLSK